MKRLFIAIPLEQEIINKIESYITHYKETPVLKDAKWVSKENYHITLLFLGDVSDRVLPEVTTFIRAVCAHISPFDLSLDRVTFFPTKDTAHMIWLRFKRSLQFIELSKEIFKYLYDIDMNLKEDEKDPIPHVTLARLHELVPVKAITWPTLNLPPIKVTQCHLYESTLTPEGPIYTLLDKFPLDMSNYGAKN